VQLLTSIDKHIDNIYRELDAQITRTAMLQTELDDLRAEIRGLLGTSNLPTIQLSRELTQRCNHLAYRLNPRGRIFLQRRFVVRLELVGIESRRTVNGRSRLDLRWLHWLAVRPGLSPDGRAALGQSPIRAAPPWSCALRDPTRAEAASSPRLRSPATNA
jgi:hypothetical protein